MVHSYLGRRALLALAAAIPLAGCAGSATSNADGDDTAQSPLLNAPVDTENKFNVGVCTGVLNTDPAKGEVGTCQTGTSRCSGTLIAPNLVLTARHCLRQFQSTGPGFCDGNFTDVPRRPGGTRITTSLSVLAGAPKWIEADNVNNVFVPPENKICSDDVALLVLPENVTDARPVAWVDLTTDLRARPPYDGKTTVVGRGLLDHAIDPATGAVKRLDDGGLKRRILREVPFKCAGVGCTIPDFSDPTGNYNFHEGQFGIGASTVSGDSGTSIFYHSNFRWRPTVIGVSVANAFGADGEVSGSINIRLDPHASWIKQVARDAARAGKYPTPRWATDCSLAEAEAE